MSDISLNLATTRGTWGLAEAIDGCLRHGISTVSPWRDQVDALGLAPASRLVRDSGITVASLCRGGAFPADTAAGRAAAVADNRKAVDEAAAIGAPILVLVVGTLPAGSRDLPGTRQMVMDGIAEVLPYARQNGVTLGIEPLHPVYAGDRAAINTIDQALDCCEMLGEGVGVVIDTYHTWWDPNLEGAIARAGRAKRLLMHHISDWLVPTRDPLLDRGMMGDGVIDFRRFRALVEAAGYHGPQEVEIFSAENWWKRSGDEVLRVINERVAAVC
jgi:sugar phosphate isomerase/epimerase